MEYGAAGAASARNYGSHSIPENTLAETVDHLIAALPEHLHKVIKAEYLAPGSQKQKAKRLRCSYDAFTYRLRAAKRLLAAGIA